MERACGRCIGANEAPSTTSPTKDDCGPPARPGRYSVGMDLGAVAMLNARLLVTILLLVGPSGASAQMRAPSPQAAPGGRVSQLSTIPLRAGVNRVARFSQDGREAQI